MTYNVFGGTLNLAESNPMHYSASRGKNNGICGQIDRHRTIALRLLLWMRPV